MRSYAVIPPLMLDVRQRRCVYQNENGALVDMEADFKVKFNKQIYLCLNISIIYFRNDKILISGQVARKKYLKRNFYNIPKILERLVVV